MHGAVELEAQTPRCGHKGEREEQPSFSDQLCTCAIEPQSLRRGPEVKQKEGTHFCRRGEDITAEVSFLYVEI